MDHQIGHALPLTSEYIHLASRTLLRLAVAKDATVAETVEVFAACGLPVPDEEALRAVLRYEECISGTPQPPTGVWPPVLDLEGSEA